MLRALFVTSVLILAGIPSLRAQEAGTASAAPADAREPPLPTFTAEVEQVIVDLVVTDKKGNPVSGISEDDLVLVEDDVVQSLSSFESVELPDAPAEKPPPPPVVSKNTGRDVERGRTFVIIFDDMNLSPHRAHDAKAAVASFLQDGMREGDYVTLIATSGAAWWTTRMEAGRDQLIDTVKRLDGRKIPDHSLERMTDWEAMRIHVSRDPQVSRQVLRRFEKYGVTMRAQRNRDDPLTGTVNDPFVTARAASQYFNARTRLRVALEVIERALNGLASAKGRKSVILLSGGFIYDPNLDEFDRVRAASRRANAAIYFVNARGLDGMPVEFSAEFGPSLPAEDIGFAFASMNRIDDGSENLAADTGGFTVKNTNDLSSGIQRISRETQLYYLLGYVSSNAAHDGTYRKIKVKFKKGRGKGLKIRARKGYYAPTESGVPALTGKEGIDPVLQAALDSPWPEDGIPLRMTHYVGSEQMLGRASTLLVTEVDIRALQLEEVEGRHVGEISFLLVVAQRETGEFFRFDQIITLRLRPSTRDRLARVWFPIARDFELAQGDYQAKIIVREKTTGLLGSVVHEFQVPSQEEFRVSTPILTDTHRTAEDRKDIQAKPLARREFPRGGQLVCSFEVYGAVKDEATGMPRVVQGYQVLASDGAVLLSVPPSEIRPTSIGALSRLLGFPLGDIPVGEYEILMTVRDELAEKTLELREPFTVVPPVPDAAPAATAANRPAASP